jgi:hypothetical protein
MRAGGDRFEIGEQVFQMLFPEGATSLLGIGLGVPVDTVTARYGQPSRPGNPAVWDLAVEDPGGQNRRIEVAVHISNTRTGAVSARFYSRDRMDIDTAWRLVKEHLDRCHGAPAKEVGGVLAFVWTHAVDNVAATTRGSRFKDQSLENALQIETRPSAAGGR